MNRSKKINYKHYNKDAFKRAAFVLAQLKMYIVYKIFKNNVVPLLNNALCCVWPLCKQWITQSNPKKSCSKQRVMRPLWILWQCSTSRKLNFTAIKIDKSNTVIPWIVRILGPKIFHTIQNQHYSRLLLCNKRDWPLFKPPFFGYLQQIIHQN